jgi:hypothetical protein
MGNMEIELGGEREEVLQTLDELDMIIKKFSTAFNNDISYMHTNHDILNQSLKKFPQIPRTNQCGQAVISLLHTGWGDTPRTIGELREAMEANAIYFPKTTLSGVLVWLVKKGNIRRWKDNKRGYLYVQNEEKVE